MKPQSTTPQPEAPAPKKIDIICYPEGNIVKVTSDQLKELMEKGLVFYDDEWTEEKPNGQYGFNQENEDEIMKLTGSPAPISRKVEGFTQGEWAFNEEENTVSKYRIYSTKDGRNVGWFDYDEETKESELANVTLIASAPTLYRENQQLKKDIELLREALEKSTNLLAAYYPDEETSHRNERNEFQRILDSNNKALKQTEPKQ